MNVEKDVAVRHSGSCNESIMFHFIPKNTRRTPFEVSCGTNLPDFMLFVAKAERRLASDGGGVWWHISHRRQAQLFLLD